MLGFIRSATGRAGKTLTHTLAATAFMAVIMGTAQAGSVLAVGTETISPYTTPTFAYQNVEIALANGGSASAGFDVKVGAFVGDFSQHSLFDSLDQMPTGKFAAFRFTNDSTNSTDRIHEIYFESFLSGYLNDDIVFASDSTSFEGKKLAPEFPPGINPAWGGTYVGLDEGGGSKTGVVVDDWFEVIFALKGDKVLSNISNDKGGSWSEGDTIDTNFLIAGLLMNGNVSGRIAMHIGDCDNNVSCVFDTWPPGNPSVIPLPAALPLYGTGLAVMGFIGWRKRRKAAQA